MRIAFIDFILDLDKPGASGLSSVVWNIAHELASMGDDVHIIGPYSASDTKASGIRFHHVDVPPIGYRNIVGHVLIVLRSWKMARSICDLDLIFVPEYLSAGIIAPLSTTPVVMRTPGNIYERIANGNPFDWSTTQVLKVAARLSAKYCRLVIATSNDMAKWWSRIGTSINRMIVIPTGVDICHFSRVTDARHVLGLSSNHKIITYAGRLSVEKNVDVLVRAVAAIQRRDNEVYLHIVGDGPQKTELEDLCTSLKISDIIQFHGMVPIEEMPLWYSAADVVVLASSSEGLPRVMLEAMACGAPFIGSSITGIVDHVVDEKTGFLVKPGSIAQLTEKLNRVLSNPKLASSTGKRAADYVRNNLSWPKSAEALRQAIDATIYGVRSDLEGLPDK